MSELHLSQAMLDDLATLAKTHSDKGDIITAFVHAYCKTLPQTALESTKLPELAGMARHHFELLTQHTDTPKVAVFNPTPETHHFYSEHTVIQMVVKDRPFLTDTMLMSLDAQGITVQKLFTAILNVEKAGGQITSVAQASQSGTDNDNVALVHIEITPQDTTSLPKIADALLDKLATLDVIVGDWQAMQVKLKAVKDELSTKALSEEYQSKDEVLAFLDWVGDNNFIFMGFREYRFENNHTELYSVGGSGLGLLKGQSTDTLSDSFQQLPDHLKTLLTRPRVLLLSKSGHLAPVHRPVYMDFLGIQKLDDNGQVIGEYRFVGLLTSRAYQTEVANIPLLREKCKNVLATTNFVKGGHAYTKTMHILNTLPRDDLFQASPNELAPMVLDIGRLQDKNTLKLFARNDHYNRFVSCLVYIPKHKFDTALRIKIQNTLVGAFGGVSSEFSTDFNEVHHTRVHFHIRTLPGQINDVDVKALEGKLGELMHDWGDDYARTLTTMMGIGAGGILKDYLPAIPVAYKERFDVHTGATDTQKLIELSDDKPIIWRLLHGAGQASDELTLKVYGKGTPATLSGILPVLENFGVSVLSADTYVFDKTPKTWLQAYYLKVKSGNAIALDVVGKQFEAALDEIWHGRVESDRLNELILTTDIDTYDVVVLRALSRYIVQARAPFSTEYIHTTLVSNPAITSLLVKLFHAKMSPTKQSDTAPILAQINELLANVKSLDEDRIIHWVLDLLNAMLRTNFYQVDKDGQRKDRLSFKFKAGDIPNLPKPKPMFEIYVYSPRVEGVHLRGGKVARGGLRWSDRMEDYRTEVLGLVKAQMVKNAIIVPVGSKGGFVCKDKSKQASRETWQAEGVACYQTYIRGLLDLTDNLVDGKVVPPANTVRHDEDDPYLVVAADKGTATFSNIANELSKEYNFWLQDAFASGGSAGYDHKGMGITARGAWESVKRHFRLMGKDIQARDEFTVVGIGDMSGDVFGNGMLLSNNTRLVAAFNHLHIFIDPNPDSKASFAERERLFKLPRSAWMDYDASLISAGGGVFNRTDKAITITPQMKERFDIDDDSLTPNELLNKLLKAPVDLIWNGGIGTYIKSSDEDHQMVGDRANDAIRVDGKDVRALVVGEGGNLGCTQRGRIEYALNGGRIYTDAIDNSGGVNCSDHEVNIKILLGSVVERGDMTIKQRNDLLASMTDTVANLVLRQNYLQPQTIELSAHQARENLSLHARFMQFLESRGRLDRAIEFLPSEDVLAERQKEGKGLTNPEFAILLAYGKMWVYEEMLASDLPDDPYFLGELKKYFPSVLAQSYFDEMTHHRLHREIICTYLTNGLVNRLGIETVFYLFDEAGKSIAQITRGYAIARDVFDIQKAWDRLSALDTIAPASTQIAIEQDIRALLKSAILWFLNNETLADADALAGKYKGAIGALLGTPAIFDTHFANTILENANALVADGVPSDDAERFARLPILATALDVVKLADAQSLDHKDVAQAYFGVAGEIGASTLNQKIQTLPTQNQWDRRANNALSQELGRSVLALTHDVLGAGGFDVWKNTNQAKLNKLKHSLDDVLKVTSLASLSVVLSEISGLKSL